MNSELQDINLESCNFPVKELTIFFIWTVKKKKKKKTSK